MDISIILNYVNAIIFGICLCVGYVIKNLLPTDKINKYIPAIVAVLGVFLACWANGFTISPMIVLEGLISGLSSTGGYELLKNLIKKD